MKFEFNDVEIDNYNKWKRHCVPTPTAIGGAHTFCFTRTSIGDMVIVKCSCGEEANLTDYDSV